MDENRFSNPIRTAQEKLPWNFYQQQHPQYTHFESSQTQFTDLELSQQQDVIHLEPSQTQPQLTDFLPAQQQQQFTDVEPSKQQQQTSIDDEVRGFDVDSGSNIPKVENSEIVKFDDSENKCVRQDGMYVCTGTSLSEQDDFSQTGNDNANE